MKKISRNYAREKLLALNSLRIIGDAQEQGGDFLV